MWRRSIDDVVTIINYLLCVVILLGLSLVPPVVHALEKVRLQLRFDHQFQFAGYYAAHWQGYYAAAGLEVDIISGIRPDRSMLAVPEIVSRGEAEFGIGAGDILMAIDAGSSMKIIASIFQQSPVELFARSEIGLTSPADLVRLRVLQDPNPLVSAEINAMLYEEGLSPGTVVFENPVSGSVVSRIDRLLRGDIDVMPGYALSIPWYALEKGVVLSSLKPASYGVDFYGDSLFATTAFTDMHPDLVERFRDASIQGWEYALENSEEIAERIARELPRQLPMSDLHAYNQFLATKVRTLMRYPFIEVGHSNPKRWQRMYKSLLMSGVIHNPLPTTPLVFNPERSREKRIRSLLTHTLEAATLFIIIGSFLSVIYLARAKRRIEQSELRYKTLFEDSPSSIWEEDFSAVKTYLTTQLPAYSAGAREFLQHRQDVVEECAKRVRILDVNDTTVRMYKGKDKNELLQGLGGIFSEESYQAFRDELIALAEGDTEFQTETVIRDLLGDEIHIDIRLSVMPSARDTWDRIVVHMIDITERKHAEVMLRRYKQIISTTTDMMAYIDREYRYMAVNESFSRVYCKDMAEIIGSRVEDLLGKDVFNTNVKQYIDRCFQGKAVCYELPVQFPSLGECYLRVNYFPIREESGEVSGLVVHLHDLTTIKKMEQELIEHRDNLECMVEERTEQLKYAMEEIESFSYSVSHDLRAPLRSINGFCTVLMEESLDSLDDEGRDYLRRILRNVGKMDALIDGLLRLSRISHSEMQYAKVDIYPIAQELADKYRSQYPEKQYTVMVALDLVIFGDHRMIEIALDNLIGNAFKFSSLVEAPRIEIGRVNNDEMDTLFIRDNGIGFDMAYADKLYTAFQRLQSDFEGTGIGLATVRRVLLRHAGKISAESILGQGATFYIHFPVAEQSEARQMDG